MRCKACEFKRGPAARLTRRWRRTAVEMEAMQNRILAFLAFAAIACFVGAASAQAAGVTPTKGQSAEQQQKDIAECQSLATQSSGFHPFQHILQQGKSGRRSPVQVLYDQHQRILS